MQQKIKEIAVRVKELRELSELSANKLAKQLGISLQSYLAFEAGEADISASHLYEIAQILNTDLAVLLTGSSPRMDTFAVTRKGKGIKVERRKEYQYQALAANFVNKKAEPMLVTVEPRDDESVPALNQHNGQEINYVLEGKLKIVILGQEIILNEGDCIYFDSSNPHAMVALEGKAARFLAIIM